MLKNLNKPLALALLLASNISYASVWAPTDGDSNFFEINALIGIGSTNQFGIFEDTANIATALPKLVFTGGTTISFTQNGVNWDINNGSSSSTLLGSYNFQIGYNRSGTWESESGNAPAPAFLGNTTWHLAFTGSGNLVDLYAIDIVKSQAASDFPPQGQTPVPVPGAVWLMGSALIGMFSIGRRKNA